MSNRFTLSRSEWDFSSVPPRELFPCMAYELLRESASIRSQTKRDVENYQQIARQHDHDPAAVALPSWEDFRATFAPSCSLTLVAMAKEGFPERSWQDIKSEVVRRALGIRLNIWRSMPKARESASRVHEAVKLLGLEQCDEVREFLREHGVEGSSLLCWSSHAIPTDQLALLIDPEADEEFILEGVKTYLALVRESTGRIGSKKPNPGGRMPNFNQPTQVLRALGLARLAYHLPAKDAWKLISPNVSSGAVNIEIKRARELCSAAMHAHFDLPKDERPLHFLKPKAKVTKTQG